jgi:DNA-binding NarL/FixJ family response regulator
MAHSHARAAVLGTDPTSRRRLADAVRASGHRLGFVGPVVTAHDELDTATVALVFADAAGEAAAAVRAARPRPVVAVLETIDRRSVAALLRADVAGIVRVTELDRALGPTIDAVCNGQLCVPREFAAQATQPQLSTREKQILGMVVLGFANVEIAQQLVIAESTVKTHLNSAFRKLGVRTRGEATALILDPENGLGTGILTIPTSASEVSP